MPDPLKLSLAAAAAGVVAAVVAWTAYAWRGASAPRQAELLILLGVASGFYLGCWWLGVRPHWPPREDQDRLLTLLLPATLLVEVIALANVPRWPCWLLRGVVAFAAARVLLNGSVYLNNLGFGSAPAWSLSERLLLFTALGVPFLTSWVLLTQDSVRVQGFGRLMALGFCALGSGAAVMLSGYASGGQLGFPLGGAILGVAVGQGFPSWTKKSGDRAESRLPAGPIAFGLVGLFSLLVVGKFFGELPGGEAILLLFAPLLVCLPLQRVLPSRGSWLAGPLGCGLVLLMLSLVAANAGIRFNRNSQPAAQAIEDGDEEIADAYQNYGS